MAARGAPGSTLPGPGGGRDPCLASLASGRATPRALMELPASAMRSPCADCVTGLVPEEGAELWFLGVGFARDRATWASSGPEFPRDIVLSPLAQDLLQGRVCLPGT